MSEMVVDTIQACMAMSEKMWVSCYEEGFHEPAEGEWIHLEGDECDHVVGPRLDFLEQVTTLVCLDFLELKRKGDETAVNFQSSFFLSWA